MHGVRELAESLIPSALRVRTGAACYWLRLFEKVSVPSPATTVSLPGRLKVKLTATVAPTVRPYVHPRLTDQPDASYSWLQFVVSPSSWVKITFLAERECHLDSGLAYCHRSASHSLCDIKSCNLCKAVPSTKIGNDYTFFIFSPHSW